MKKEKASKKDLQVLVSRNFGHDDLRIEPTIIIEPVLSENGNIKAREIEVYCFNGVPKIIVNVRYGIKRKISCYDEKFNQIDLILNPDGNNIFVKEEADDTIKQTIDLSKKLVKYNCHWEQISVNSEFSRQSIERNKNITEDAQKNIAPRNEEKAFEFVRVDWLVFENKLYFNEMTFTPYSGFIGFDKKWNLKLGSWIHLGGIRHGF